MKKILLVLLLAFFAPLGTAYGHGVTYGVSEHHSVAVHFGYAGGEPMSYAKTKVFGPQSSVDVEYQNGRTDAQGYFAFVPNSAGLWRVITTDNRGHQGSMDVIVAKDDVTFEATAPPSELAKYPMLLKVLFALSLLANVAFVMASLKQKS